MVFFSYLFIFFFLPLALPGYYAAPKKLSHLTLTIFSGTFSTAERIQGTVC